MKLTNKQIRCLKGEAHSKKPVVSVGMKGLTESVNPDFDGSPHADRPQPNKHAGVVEKLLCSAYLNICVDFGNSMV